MTKYHTFEGTPRHKSVPQKSSKPVECDVTHCEALETVSRRWTVLFITTFYLVAVGYNRACFGIVENVYMHYFHASIEQVDWLTLSTSAVSSVVSLVLLCVLPSKEFGFRWYCQLTSYFTVGVYACHLISSFSGKLFFFSLIGQMLMGVVNTTAIILIPVVAALWFPKEEIATAVGISLGGIALGNMLGFNVPAHVLKYSSSLTEDMWLHQIRSQLSLIFLVWLSLSVAMLILTFLVVQDRPNLPPSLSEAAKRKLVVDETFLQQPLKQRTVYYLKMVLTDKTFFALILCFGVVETCYMLEVLMMGDILRFIRSELSLSTESNVIAAYFLSCYAAGALLGGLISGLVLDKTKRFKEVAVITGTFMVLFSVGFTLAVNFENVPLSLITNFLYGFFNGACYTCLYEIIVQHMYPCSEVALGAWITFFLNISALSVPLVGRWIYSGVAEIGALVFQAVVLLVATIVIIFLKPRYERYSINKGEADAVPLVESSK